MSFKIINGLKSTIFGLNGNFTPKPLNLDGGRGRGRKVKLKFSNANPQQILLNLNLVLAQYNMEQTVAGKSMESIKKHKATLYKSFISYSIEEACEY